VDQGRIVYDESFPDQADRADRTWGKYKKVELSPLIAEYQRNSPPCGRARVKEARGRLTPGH